MSCPGKHCGPAPSRELVDSEICPLCLLVTFDKDFGALVFQLGMKASHGIVLFRIAQASVPVICSSQRFLTWGRAQNRANCCFDGFS